MYANQIQKLAQTIVDLTARGIKPSKRKIIEIMGGSFSSPWLNDGFEEVKALSNNFTNMAPVKRRFKIVSPELKDNTRLLEVLKAQNHDLLKDVQALKNELSQESMLRQSAEKELASIERDRQAILNEILKTKDSQIELLNKELADTYREHRSQFSDFSQGYDGKLIAKEVEVIHLKDKVAALSSRKKALEEKVIGMQKTITSLMAENERLINA